MRKVFQYTICLIFMLSFLKCNREEGPKTSSKLDLSEITNCRYISTVEILGNEDCSIMFCHATKGECEFKNGEKKEASIICNASENSDGGYICPTAYDCATGKAQEYDEAMNKTSSFIFNHKCEGAVQHPNSAVIQGS